MSCDRPAMHRLTLSWMQLVALSGQRGPEEFETEWLNQSVCVFRWSQNSLYYRCKDESGLERTEAKHPGWMDGKRVG